MIHIPIFSSDNMLTIYSKIFKWGFQDHPESWKKEANNIASLSIAIYQKALKVLLPLPGKSHYVFNLRQVSEIV
jgi:hypothetical protein